MALYHFSILISLPFLCTALVLQNTTLPLPTGSTNHNTPGLLCTPTKPIDLLTFYLFNYVAHAATVLTRPGERADDYLVAVLGSLLFPALGLYRGVEAVLSAELWERVGRCGRKRKGCGEEGRDGNGDVEGSKAGYEKADLRKAARSGALCFVVRGPDWRPVDGDELRGAVYRPTGEKNMADHRSSRKPWRKRPHDPQTEAVKEKETDNNLHIIPFSPPHTFTRFGSPVFIHRGNIHGTHSLPPGYLFAILPHDTEFQSPSITQSTTSLPAPYPTIKSLLSLAQSAYALTTLYRAQGDQIAQFGYAAFGLTVAPYAVMSAMNLLGNLCRPEYSSLYMVEGEMMREARGRGGVFEGVVGEVGEVGKERDGNGEEYRDGVGERVGKENGKGNGRMGGGRGLEEVDIVKFIANGEGEVRACFAHTRDLREDIRVNDKELSVAEIEVEDLISPISMSTATTRTYPGASVVDTTIPPSSTATCTAHIPTTSFAIAPIPSKLNYANTETSALLLIPSHPPIPRTSSPLCAYTISSLPLRRAWPTQYHRHYHPAFSSSAQCTTALRLRVLKYVLTCLIALLPLVLNGLLSHFKSGSIPLEESSTWRVFTLQWLVVGVLTGLWFVYGQEGKDGMASGREQVGPWTWVLLYITSASPAVGGYIVVGQMIVRYGVCVWMGD